MAIAVVSFIGAIFAALLGAWAQSWFSSRAARRHKQAEQPEPVDHSIKGPWKSAWGKLPSGPTANEERLMVTEQDGLRIRAHATMKSQPNKKWDIEGRYDGRILQLYYYPSRDAKDKDSMDYGCYFLQRDTSGRFSGVSAGYGTEDDGTPNAIFTDYHEMTRLEE